MVASSEARDSHGRWVKGISSGPAKKLMFGPQSSFRLINESLRGKGKMSKDVLSKVQSIDEDIAKNGRSVSAEQTLYRVISVPDNSALLNYMKPGKSFQDNGFTATTVDRAWADRFEESDLGHTTVMMNIKPSGITRPKALYNAEEEEYLYQRGNHFRVDSVKKTAHGIEVNVLMTRLIKA